MVIYIDLIVILNLFIDFIILVSVDILEDELKNLNEFTLGIEKSFDINRLINQQEKRKML